MQEGSRKRGRSTKVSRDRILEASLAEFAENGYEGATTAAVARRVGVTQPLIHYHFGSKEALWRAAVELAFGRMGTVLQGVEDDVRRADPRDAIGITVRRFVYFNARYPEVARLIISESAVRTPRLEWMVEKHVRPLVRQLESLFSVGLESGILKPLPIQSVIFAFLGAVPHFFDAAPMIDILWGMNPLSPENVESHADTLVEMFTTGLFRSPSGG